MAIHAERLKRRHAVMMRTLHAELRRFPGGFQEVGAALGRAPQSVANAFNPNDFDAAPAADLLLDVIELAQARDAVAVLAAHVGMALVECVDRDDSPASVPEAFYRLMHETGGVMTACTEALADGRISSSERATLLREINEQIEAAVSLRNRIMEA